MIVKYKLAIVAALTSFAFWIPIFSLFTEQQGITSAQSYFLLSVYSFAVVLLEYPTGLFGDFVSHRASTLLGYVLTAAAFISTLFISGFYPMLFFFIVASLGITFISGSDAAYRYSLLGENFKKDYPFIKITGTIATLLGISLGPILFTFHPLAPLLLNGISFACAAAILLTLPKVETQKSPNEVKGNVFTLAKKGVKSIIHSPVLPALLFNSAVIGAIAINMKWIYPTLFKNSHYDITFWGFTISTFYVARILGTFIYKKITQMKVVEPLLLACLVCLIVSMGFITSIFILFPVLFIEFFLVGILETSFDIEIQNNADSEVRASTLSLSSLLERLVSGSLIALLGLLSTNSNFAVFGTITAGLVVIALITTITVNKKLKT